MTPLISNAGKATAGLPVPPRSSAQQVALGARVFVGQVRGVQLSQDDLKAVAAYVWALGHQTP